MPPIQQSTEQPHKRVEPPHDRHDPADPTSPAGAAANRPSPAKIPSGRGIFTGPGGLLGGGGDTGPVSREDVWARFLRRQGTPPGRSASPSGTTSAVPGTPTDAARGTKASALPGTPTDAACGGKASAVRAAGVSASPDASPRTAPSDTASAVHGDIASAVSGGNGPGRPPIQSFFPTWPVFGPSLPSGRRPPGTLLDALSAHGSSGPAAPAPEPAPGPAREVGREADHGVGGPCPPDGACGHATTQTRGEPSGPCTASSAETGAEAGQDAGPQPGTNTSGTPSAETGPQAGAGAWAQTDAGQGGPARVAMAEVVALSAAIDRMEAQIAARLHVIEAAGMVRETGFRSVN
ncbi:MAG TPA: hypothetical protein VIR33_15480, partial [Thermopolyspora sp.]